MLDEDLKCFIDKGYYRKSVSKTCLTLPVGWMDNLQGVEGMDNSELIEESQSEEYTSYVYDLWKKAACLAHRVYSRGEKDSFKFLGRKESKKTKHV